MKGMKRISLLALIVAGTFVTLRGWNDEDLFTTVVRTGAKPNVVFLQDVSGSMAEGIYHPDYDPNTLLSTSGSANFGNISSATRTSWYIRWVNGTTIRDSTGYVTISSFTAPNTLVLNNRTTYIRAGDWILSYNGSSSEDRTAQMVAKVTDVHTDSSTTTLTLDASTIKGTPTVGYRVYICSYNSSSYTTRVVTLYGTNIDQNNVRYDQDSYNYLEWIFTVANDSQRDTITSFSTLGDHVDYNAYLRTTPVSPAAATNPDNPSETLLAEWNRVWPLIFPSKIASLGTDIINTTTSIPYTDAKSTFQGYSGNFYIKIDSETMLVSANAAGSTSDSGTLTVVRAQRNTLATKHAASSAILIFNQTSSPVINEYTPVTSLFSSTQHVNESTGMLDPTFTETVNVGGTNKTCWRYKRVFTRIQTSREALGDVITARNKLLKVAELENTITSSDTYFTYLNGSTNFITMDPSVATFYIKVVDPDHPASDEVMLVTGHDSATRTLSVSRAQQGTTAVAHNIGSAIEIYTGIRDEVILGLFTFTTRSPQNTVMEFGLNDFGQKNADGTYKSASYINTAVLDPIWNNVNALNNTPIAISLADVWQYFKPSSSSSSPNYRSGENWQVVTSNQGFETLSDGYTHPKGSPMQYWCQNNYVVVITDGQANGDTGLKSSTYGVFGNKVQRNAAPTPGEYCRWDYSNGWGDLDAHDVGSYYNYQGTSSRTYCPGETCWISSSGSDLLDDVAYFMYHQDMFPTRKVVGGELVTDPLLYDEVNSDPRRVWKGDQRICTYTVGLTMRNDMLAETAANGHGLNFAVSNYQDLGESFISILENIKMREDPMMYTTYAAPKQSVTAGKYGYVAHFVPREAHSMWEGHLRRFRLGDDGNFPANIDTLSRTNRGEVCVGGDCDTPSLQWDVEWNLMARSTPRLVYTAKGGTRVDFNGSAITYADLGVANSTVAATVKSFITNFDSSYTGTNGWLYGDTFHFNPILVGYPLKWKAAQDPSYNSFYTRYAVTYPRKEVVYVGANDGKLHCFITENDSSLGVSGGDELWSFIPPSQLTKLQIPALNPSSSGAHTYFVDGKALAKDIRVSTTYGDYRDWRTVLFFGMGIGGRSYCALDITDPLDPKFLWEFDDGYSASNTDGRMGFTEAKPVVVDINNGSATFSAVILPGGYNQPEVPADSSDAGIQDWIKKEGKALYILNAYTGALVKKFIYGATANSSTVYANPNFTCAMTAAPAVFDYNNDGIADYIYQADTGDYHVSENRGARIWKISCMGSPINWTAQELYQAEAGQTLFISPSLGYTDNTYRLAVMFGTGRRSVPTAGSGGVYTNLTGQYVCFLDTPAATYPLTNADLTDVTSTIRNESSTSFELKDNAGNNLSQGFYFDFVKASNEIMFEPNPLYLNGTLYFMTFAPQGSGGGSSSDPCSGDSGSGGQHYIYQFGMNTSGNTLYINDAAAIAGKLLGYGALSGTQYKLYIGESNVGGFVSTSTPPIEITNIFGPMLWKEDKPQ
jgi:hypothetical protein